MTIVTACKNVLNQLSDSLTLISNEEFRKPIMALNGSTIGQHTRHTIEFFKCLSTSYDSGQVDYDARERKIEIESDKGVSIEELEKLMNWLESPIDDKKLRLAVNYSLEDVASTYIES
jgi:hypothetical protein